ncbi:MAG: hypothetical protein CBC25_01625 [Pelagibacteraceae bacterium TMED65]|nr:cyclohexadienyl dehydrogenase [Rickettsiales bacterium]OUU53072.1 MAG: hypothetical protein CBC25_01625 [Pelagibacteraceae bacterium TMED65]|tara:strand:- start:3737 stop:4603 length:867 start_codon:yes stop_codon:yes gene_type:complete
MFNEITIIGPGLIGASLGLALKSKKICKKIVGIDKSQANLKDAIKIKAIDEGRNLVNNEIKKSSIIFICTPVSKINNLILEIAKHSTKNQIISDVGSVKDIFNAEILKLNNKKFSLVPGHPIAGTEYSGAANSKKNLFQNKWCILTPIKNKDKSTKLISKIWEDIGMKVAIMKIKEHDKIMSITSHLPHLIAFTIVGTAFNLDIKKKQALINFSAGGFKDFTRIGSSDPQMWTDIFFANKEYLNKTFNTFLKDIESFMQNLNSGNSEEIFMLLKRTKQIRKSILKKGI